MLFQSWTPFRPFIPYAWWWWVRTCNVLLKNRRVWRHSVMSRCAIRWTLVVVCIPQLMWRLRAAYAVQAMCTGGPVNQEISTVTKPRIVRLSCYWLNVILSQCYVDINHNIHECTTKRLTVNVPYMYELDVRLQLRLRQCAAIPVFYHSNTYISLFLYINLCAPVLLTIASLSLSSVYVEQYK